VTEDDGEVLTMTQSLNKTNIHPETNLVTHDIALSIPDPRTESHDVSQLLLLSPEDIDNPHTLARIQQFHHHSHGRNAGLLFLLHHPEGTQAAMKPFMDLHIQYVVQSLPNHITLTTYNLLTLLRRLTTHRLTLPIIPIASPESDPNALITALQAFQSSLAAARAAQHPHRPVDAARDLLPYCTVAGTKAVSSEATNRNPSPYINPYISGSGSGSDSAGTPAGTSIFSGSTTSRVSSTVHPSGSGSLSGGGNNSTSGSGSLSLSHGGNGASNHTPTFCRSTPPAAALSSRAVEALSQRWFSFGALLGELGTEGGGRVVRDMVGAWEGEGVVAFWGDEFEVAKG
jgi:hypothetical protein